MVVFKDSKPAQTQVQILLGVKVCIPELVLNETRQDETVHHFPNWQYREKTTS